MTLNHLAIPNSALWLMSCEGREPALVCALRQTKCVTESNPERTRKSGRTKSTVNQGVFAPFSFTSKFVSVPFRLRRISAGTGRDISHARNSVAGRAE